MNLHHQIQKFSRSLALVAPQHATAISTLALDNDRGDDTTQMAVGQSMSAFGMEPDKRKPFPFAAGLAIIPVYGALLHRDNWCSPWATGYDFISTRLHAALGDDDVKGIVFDINSYGGHVAGNFELCDQIYAGREKKPMLAVLDSKALSGGYSIASAVGRIVATPSGEAGSIGVVMMHVSYEKMYEDAGVKVSYIYAGDHKIDGNPFEDLPEDVRAALQASVNKSYTQFVDQVARNRGMAPEAVRATQAKVYDADEAKTVGLIDDVASPRAALASFLSEVSASTSTTGVKTMNIETPEKKGEGGSDSASTVDAAKIAAEASANERARVAGILGCEAAKDRPALANHLAVSTSMSVEDAEKVLAAAGAEKSAGGDTNDAFRKAMEAGGSTGVGDGGGDGDDDKKMSAGERIARTHHRLNGTKPAKLDR